MVEAACLLLACICQGIGCQENKQYKPLLTGCQNAHVEDICLFNCTQKCQESGSLEFIFLLDGEIICSLTDVCKVKEEVAVVTKTIEIRSEHDAGRYQCKETTTDQESNEIELSISQHDRAGKETTPKGDPSNCTQTRAGVMIFIVFLTGRLIIHF